MIFFECHNQIDIEVRDLNFLNSFTLVKFSLKYHYCQTKYSTDLVNCSRQCYNWLNIELSVSHSWNSK